MSHQLMIVAHGTTDPAGQAESFQLLEEVRALRPNLRADLSFLELCPPPISEAVAAAVADGVDRMTIQPLVLLGAGHAKGDVPAAIAAERDRHPHVTFTYGAPLGIRPEILELTDRRLREAVPESEREETAVILIGRGTSDPDANGDLFKAARLLWEGRPWPIVEAGFVSLAQPSVPEALERCRALGAKRIALLPYFLFTGVLERRIRQQTHEWAAANPDVAVIDAPYLGPDRAVAEALLARADETESGQVRVNCDTCQYRVALPGFEHRVGAPQTLHYHPDDPGTHAHHHGDHAHDHHQQHHAERAQ
ncbi:sirohydrochlorin chelatase [Glycomyces luteolus]|uniref:Sirohydrochlorin chelatase n=1 Tax=Glycomyces luteolus TaxID=2670330 RepID=A0A9X3SRX4_9ACTN|nr:sirohydrochlorin chelatase [Glycomyces luteolus]MDA1361901.1 sirohydrochlorin chelatase [Glycomyces luteolus]